MIKILIPSYNRAVMLDLLLRSIRDHWTLKGLNIFVLFRYSNEEFREGYDKLKNKWCLDNISFIKEENFGEQVKELLYPSEKFPYTGWMCDDGVIFRNLNIFPEEFKNFMSEDILCFSGRLGINTVIQNYITNEYQPYSITDFDHEYIYDEKLLKWNWKQHHWLSNNGYFYSTDFHIYHSEWLWNAVKNIKIDIYRCIEHQVITNTKLSRKSSSWMVCPSMGSVFFSNSINCVQDVKLQAGVKNGYNIEELNRLFLEGNQINLDMFKNLNIIGCHDEISINFERSYDGF